MRFNQEIMKKYIQSVDEMTLASFQEKMSMSEEDAKKLIWELVHKGVLEHTVGFLFRYTGSTIPTIEPFKEKSVNRHMRAFFDDDDDDWDIFGHEEEKKEEPKMDDYTLKKPSFLSSADEDIRRGLAQVAGFFGKAFSFNIIEGENAYVCELGMTYMDDTPMRIKLSYDNGKAILSDYGLTCEFLAKYLDLGNAHVYQRIQNVMSDYSLDFKETDDELELYVVIEDEESAFIAFLCLFGAIERLSSLPCNEGLFAETLSEYEAYCQKETVRIVVGEKATHRQAKEIVQGLLSQATEKKDAFLQNVYMKIFSSLCEMTEVGYKDFQARIMRDES